MRHRIAGGIDRPEMHHAIRAGDEAAAHGMCLAVTDLAVIAALSRGMPDIHLGALDRRHHVLDTLADFAVNVSHRAVS